MEDTVEPLNLLSHVGELELGFFNDPALLIGTISDKTVPLGYKLFHSDFHCIVLVRLRPEGKIQALDLLVERGYAVVRLSDSLGQAA